MSGDKNAIPYIAHESAMARSERMIKRLWILCIIMFIAFVVSNAAWIFYEAQFEMIETSIEAEQKADGGGSNYAIGGDIYGIAESYDHG